MQAEAADAVKALQFKDIQKYLKPPDFIREALFFNLSLKERVAEEVVVVVVERVALEVCLVFAVLQPIHSLHFLSMDVLFLQKELEVVV
jgi:hypothetical protein